jgi:hypothetical protein
LGAVPTGVAIPPIEADQATASISPVPQRTRRGSAPASRASVASTESAIG